jgi:hypothetical protein
MDRAGKPNTAELSGDLHKNNPKVKKKHTLTLGETISPI